MSVRHVYKGTLAAHVGLEVVSLSAGNALMLMHGTTTACSLGNVAFIHSAIFSEYMYSILGCLLLDLLAFSPFCHHRWLAAIQQCCLAHNPVTP